MSAFADRLWRLKQEAGDPSYEEMSARMGAAASRSSLAAAAKGRSLPSWETTWEFVRVLAVDRLGRDPRVTEREWREHWRQAKAAGLSAAEPAGAAEPAATPPAGGTGAAAAAPETGATAAGRLSGHEPFGSGQDPAAQIAGPPAPPVPGSPRRFGIAVVAAAVVALAGVVLALVVLGRQPDGSGAGAPPVAAASPDHDDSQFEGDITYPDGTVVPPNSSFTKIWRIRNTGTVFWANRFLARVNEQPCQAPAAVAVPQTKPGETVDIAVTVRTSGRPGRCKIYWKMADEQGRTLFPLKRPIFLDVQVGSP